jgi:glutathione S-transferase
MEETMTAIELYQFQGSHFNEKARWGLDLKHVPYQGTSLLPGPHMRTMKKLTGKSETPALVDGETVVSGSAAILEHLEQRFPDPALFPEDPSENQRARNIVRHWDAEIGPAVRLVKFFHVLEADYVVGTFGQGQTAFARGMYRLGFPVISRVMMNKMNINAETAAEAREITRAAFDYVAKEPNESGYLVGDRFTVADLTCAALLMPCVPVSEWGGPVDAQTKKNHAFLAEWADHPGAEWVREIYRRHRKN